MVKMATVFNITSSRISRNDLILPTSTSVRKAVKCGSKTKQKAINRGEVKSTGNQVTEGQQRRWLSTLPYVAQSRMRNWHLFVQILVY